MKEIYIILTHTGTVLSRIIRCYTKDEYSHVSIALDKSLENMYSFGRLNPYNPFFGGFVHEKVNEGVYKRFKNTKTCIYSLEIEDSKYRKIEKTINKMKKNKDMYKFNTLGLIAVSINLRIKQKNHFYCAEFVKYILEKSKIKYELPDIIRPEDFKNISNLKTIYKGRLNDYNLYRNALVYSA